MPDAPQVEEKDSQDSTVEKGDSKPAGAEATVTVQGGRRRGRRKVMKKKKVKDEDGYLGKRIAVSAPSHSLTPHSD